MPGADFPANAVALAVTNPGPTKTFTQATASVSRKSVAVAILLQRDLWESAKILVKNFDAYSMLRSKF
jgi:hypothetical protein